MSYLLQSSYRNKLLRCIVLPNIIRYRILSYISSIIRLIKLAATTNNTSLPSCFVMTLIYNTRKSINSLYINNSSAMSTSINYFALLTTTARKATHSCRFTSPRNHRPHPLLCQHSTLLSPLFSIASTTPSLHDLCGLPLLHLPTPSPKAAHFITFLIHGFRLD